MAAIGLDLTGSASPGAQPKSKYQDQAQRCVRSNRKRADEATRTRHRHVERSGCSRQCRLDWAADERQLGPA